MRRFYAPPEQVQQTRVFLTIDETRHLRDVLRLREGENIQVFNGHGKEFLCSIEEIGKQKTTLKIIKEILPSAPESNLELSLAVALLKGEKFDLVIQKAVELGIMEIIPIITKRTDVKLKDADKKIERWRKIILEASKQCGRAKLMKIDKVVDFADFIQSDRNQKILFSERNGTNFAEIKGDENIIAIIGSEGGWEESEIEFAKENGVKIITLGGRILRAETAAIVIPALLQNHFGDLN